jgi:hypothetical protein
MNLNGHNAAPGTSEECDRRAILQVNATMITGVLFFLTLASIVILPQTIGRFFLGTYTFSINIPFIVSAVIIILKPTHFRKAKMLTVVGFLFLLVNLIGGLTYFSLTLPSPGAIIKSVFTSIEKECAKNPGGYGVDVNHPWKCSMFSPGSLAEQCAIDEWKNPSECSKFIPPSNST